MDLNRMFDDPQVRALAQVAGTGDVETIEKLARQGVDVSSQGAGGATVPFWALREGSLRGFEKLLDLGADPNETFSGGSVVHWAARHEDIRFLKATLDHGGNPNLVGGRRQETPIFQTIGSTYRREAMLLLLDRGADINAVTGGEMILGMSMGGRTPAMFAAQIVRFDIVYDLLVRGADYELEDDNGRSLLDRIARMSKRDFRRGSDQKLALDKVVAWLSARGVDL